MAAETTSIERRSRVPLYYQLKQLLEDEIRRGTWRAGELIPGEQELQTRYNLSRTTVRQALRELEVEGKIIRYRGRGTFVSTPKLSHSPQSKHGLTQSLLERGMVPGWKLISATTESAPSDVALRLGFAAGSDVFRLIRLRLANDEPIGLHVAHLAPGYVRFIEDANYERGGSLDYLAKPALARGSHSDRIIDAVSASDELADYLGVEVSSPMLRVRRLVTTGGNQPVEDLVATYRGDRFEYRLRGSAPTF